MRKIPLSNPDITDIEKESVLSVLNTPELSLGPKLLEFENKFSNYIGSRYAVAVNSGTSGLHLSIISCNIGYQDYVLTTPFSFIASANCILFEKARPIFIDINPRTRNIDIEKLDNYLIHSRNKKTKAPRAIVLVHTFGLMCEMDEIMQLAKKYKLIIIEDACEAIGAEYNNKKAGTFGELGVFAFYPNKQITTGEGGMIVTDNRKIASMCKSLRNQGRNENPAWLEHQRLGFNYRISDINCALGIAQLFRIDEILKKRQHVADLYNEKLAEVNEIELPYMNKKYNVSWFVYVIQLSSKYTREIRDCILFDLKANGIGCSNYFNSIHLQPFYKKTFGFKRGDFPVTEYISDRTIALPFYNNLDEDNIEYIVNKLKSILLKYKP